MQIVTDSDRDPHGAWGPQATGVHVVGRLHMPRRR